MGKQEPTSSLIAFVCALRELAPAFDLVVDDQLVKVLSEHYFMLLKWNQKVDLTSVVDPVDVARFHYLESLYAIRFLTPQALSFVDIGSGAGFPGFPIAVSRLNLFGVLIESQTRKAVFLRACLRQLGVNNVSVFHGRFQDYQPRDFDVVLCRAIDRFSDVLLEILRFGESAQQILLFVGNDLLEKCLALAEMAWEVHSYAIPLSHRRFLVSLLPTRST